MTQPKSVSMKTIGIIGGLGPQATIDIMDRMHKACNGGLVPQNANSGYPPMYVGFCRDAPMALAADGLTLQPLQPSPALLKVAKDIGAIADFLIIASNTPHLFRKEIEEVSGRQVLSIVDVTVAEARRRRLKKVGILAVGEALKRGLYQKPLDAIGVMWEKIPEWLSEKLDKSIFALMEGSDAARLRKPALEAVAYLRALHTDGIVFGCTELPLLLWDICEQEDIINPSQLLAEAAVRFAMGKGMINRLLY